MRRTLLTTGILLACLGVSAPAAANDAWPTGPVRIIHGSAVGGGADAMTRLIAERLQAKLGKPFLVEARPGANGTIAIMAAKAAPADGNTILLSFSQIVQNVVQSKKTSYALDDFAPVSQVAIHPVVLAVGEVTGIRSFSDYVAKAKATPHSVTYASFGIGSTGHLIGAGLDKLARLETTHVAYKGDATTLPDLVSGRITAAYGAMGFYLQQQEAGKVKVLAVGSPKRLGIAPDVPTFGELNYPDVNVPAWTGLFVRSGTASDIVQRLSDEASAIIRDPDFRKQIEKFGFEAVGSSAAEFRKTLDADLALWKGLVSLTGVTLD